MARKRLSYCGPTRDRIWERDRGCCVLCGVRCRRFKKDRYDADPTLGEIDHIRPLVYGGTNEETNLRLLCKSCNRKKGAWEKSRYMEAAAV